MCGHPIEDVLHALRDCTRPRQTLQMLLVRSIIPEFWACVSLDSWMELNLDRPRDLFASFLGWSYVFREAIYSFWRLRNLEIFHGGNVCRKLIILARLILDKILKLFSAWRLEVYHQADRAVA